MLNRGVLRAAKPGAAEPEATGAGPVALLVADIYEAAGLLRRAGDAIAAQEGQTQSRWQALSVVSEHALTVPQAARRLGITRQAFQRVANDLVADGLATLAHNPDHRSSPLLSLTPAGQTTLTAITERAGPLNAALTTAAAPAQLTAAHALLQDMIDMLRQAT